MAEAGAGDDSVEEVGVGVPWAGFGVGDVTGATDGDADVSALGAAVGLAVTAGEAQPDSAKHAAATRAMRIGVSATDSSRT
jgi:hypothetical protein